MRTTTSATAIAVFIGLSVPALTQSSNPCTEAKDHRQAIAACSDVIRSHPKDAVAYHVRGDALAKNGDLGQAIADYSKAIELNPAYTPAYNGRAQVFVTKGDYTRAVADVTKASEVGSQKGQQVKAKEPVRAKPKMSTRTAAKVKDKKGEAIFNPFADGASPQ